MCVVVGVSLGLSSPPPIRHIIPYGCFTGGFYMLLDPKKAKSQQKSALLSPVSQSRGCLSLSLHYTLRASSPGASLTIFAKPVGECG